MLDGNSSGQLLFIGGLKDVFIEGNVRDTLPCRVVADVEQALVVLEEESYDVVAFKIPTPAANFRTDLNKIRKAAAGSKLILISRMYQEPIAMSYMHPDKDGNTLADDYMVCPLSADEFDQWFEGKQVSAIEKDAEVIRRIKELERLATEDDLTGLKNRRYIWEFMRQVIELAKEQNGRMTLLVFDIDNFKHYNDKYGHHVGDEILKQAAVLIRRCCRKYDVVGRIGGDEFAVVFWSDPSREQKDDMNKRSLVSEHPKEALFIVERFRKQWENTEFNLLGPDGTGVLTISGGLATYPRDGSDVEQLLRKADEGLLEAKSSGKNQIYLVGQPKKNI